MNQETNQEDVIEQLEFVSVLDIEAIEGNINEIMGPDDDNNNNFNNISAPIPTQQEEDQIPNEQIVELFAEFQKVSPHFLETNSTYYCTLQKNKFIYYHTKNKNKPLGILDFDHQKYTFTCTSNKDGIVQSFKFQAVNHLKIFEFVIPSKLKQIFTDEWAPKIHQYLLQSYGYRKNLISLTKYYRFWRHERILHEQISYQAQTGDLIVFRTKGNMPQLQRSITRSDYDHIVMFIRVDQQLLLLESSNQYGVITFSYDRFVRARSYRNFEKILYIPLQNISEDKRQKMADISFSQLGKGYSLSMMKLFRKSKRQNFFCSELIAYIYQCVGIIGENQKCCSFLPGDFTTEKERIKLQQNSELGKEYIIDYYQQFQIQ